MRSDPAQCSLGPVKCFLDHAEMASHDVAMFDLKPDTLLRTSDCELAGYRRSWHRVHLEKVKRAELKRIFKVGSYLQFKCHVWVV